MRAPIKSAAKTFREKSSAFPWKKSPFKKALKIVEYPKAILFSGEEENIGQSDQTNQTQK